MRRKFPPNGRRLNGISTTATTPLSRHPSVVVFFFSVAIPLLSFSLLRNSSPQASPTESPTLNSTSPQVDRKNNYIVRFTEYKIAGEHREYLQLRFRSPGWGWIERRNPAARFPTDFGLVWIEESAREGVVWEIERLGMVKDVNVDASYRRGLLRERKRRTARVGLLWMGRSGRGRFSRRCRLAKAMATATAKAGGGSC